MGDQEDETVKLWIGNFPYGTSEDDLHSLFDSYRIRTIDMLNTSETKKTASAILTVEEPDLAIRQMDGFSFKGRPLGVRVANKISPDRRSGTHQLDRCKILVQQLQPMINNVLDKCSLCSTIKSLITELSWMLLEENGNSASPANVHHQLHGPIRDFLAIPPPPQFLTADNFSAFSKPENYMGHQYQFQQYQTNNASPVPPGLPMGSSRPARGFVQTTPPNVRNGALQHGW